MSIVSNNNRPLVTITPQGPPVNPFGSAQNGALLGTPELDSTPENSVKVQTLSSDEATDYRAFTARVSDDISELTSDLSEGTTENGTDIQAIWPILGAAAAGWVVGKVGDWAWDKWGPGNNNGGGCNCNCNCNCGGGGGGGR